MMGAMAAGRKCLAAPVVLLGCLLFSGAAGAQPAPSKGPTDSWQNPAKAADPPVLPAPTTSSPPTSTSGTDLVPAEAPVAPAIILSDKEAAASKDSRLSALEERVARDEARMSSLEQKLGFLRHLRIGAYVQPQFLTQSFNTAASPNLQSNGLLPPNTNANDTIARSDGTTTNATFFRVRRARLLTFFETDPMRLFLQIDGTPEGGVGPGIGTILRNAEATGIARWTPNVRTEFTAGLFLIPFRRELLELALDRPFIERTWFIQNVFPTERDFGAHAKTVALDDRLALDLAIINGQAIGAKTFVALPDLNRAKDYLAHLTYKLGFLTVGTSGYLGKGQIVDATALRFKQYDKSAINFEVSAEARVIRRLGASRLYAELTFGQNMDMGVIYPFAAPSIPTNISDKVASIDERAFYVRVEQDLGRWVTAGYRFDTYTPDSSLTTNARDTHALLAVARISRNLRWMNEVGFAIDNVHPSGASPPSKHIVYFSSVLQAMF
jgi:hypothetical protein